MIIEKIADLKARAEKIKGHIDALKRLNHDPEHDAPSMLVVKIYRQDMKNAPVIAMPELNDWAKTIVSPETIIEELERQLRCIDVKMSKVGDYRTRVSSIQEGWDLICAIMRGGYEGVQNDSSRYNDTNLAHAFRDADHCWIGIAGNYHLRVIDTHDKFGKREFLDVGKSRFVERYGLELKHQKLPKSLKER